PAHLSARRAFRRSCRDSDNRRQPEVPKAQPWTAFRGSFRSPLYVGLDISPVESRAPVTPKSRAGCIVAVATRRHPPPSQERAMGIIWTIIIGFVAGVIAKFIMPGD